MNKYLPAYFLISIPFFMLMASTFGYEFPNEDSAFLFGLFSAFLGYVIIVVGKAK